MANVVFNKLIAENNDNLVTEDLFDLLTEDQTGISILIDYINVAIVDELPRIVYVTRGE